MISADAKTDVKQELKELVDVSYNFSQKSLLKTLKYNVKQACIFHLILVGIASNLILSVKNRGRGGGGRRGGEQPKSVTHDKSYLLTIT